jgi:hypothetical protein
MTKNDDDVVEESMKAAIERLRASKIEYEAECKERAIDTAREWVRDDAEYGDLVRLANVQPGPGFVGIAFTQAVNPDGDLTAGELANHLGIDVADLNNKVFLADFITTAQDAYRSIATKI